MSRLATQAELVKLGRTFDVDPETLAFLRDVPAEQLRGMRAAVYERMFRQDEELFRRLARIVARLPPDAAAALALRAGPLLTARMAAETSAARMAAVVIRTPATFNADVGAYLDPRRTHDIIRVLPTQRVTEVALELVRRHDYITISRFVEYFPDDVIRAVFAAIEDEAELLHIAFFIGSKNRLDHLLGLLAPERLEALIRVVADESRDLLSPFLTVLVHVSYGLRRQLGDLAAAQGEAMLTRYVRGAHEQGLWADLLPAVAAMSDASRRAVVNLAVLRDQDIQANILVAADEHGLWGIVLPMIELMDDANREAVAGILAARPPAALRNAADAALMGERWEVLLDLVGRMPAERRHDFATTVTALGEVDPDLCARIVARAAEYGLAECFDASAGGPAVSAAARPGSA